MARKESTSINFDDMNMLKGIPVGKCMEFTLKDEDEDIKVLACRPSEDRWTFKGPDGIKGSIGLKDMKKK